MRLINGVTYDLKFQFRHGFYYAYLFVSIIYIILIRLLGNTIGPQFAILILFTDPSALGAFFIGAIYLLEKSQNTLEGLMITPFKIEEYILSKVISLTLLSLSSSLLIVIFSITSEVNFFYLMIGIVLSSFFYTLLGLIVAIYSKTTNQYFINVSFIGLFMTPMIKYLGILDTRIFDFLPGYGSLLLLDGAFNKMDPFSFIYSILLLLIWIYGSYAILKRVFYQRVILKIGGNV